MKVMVETSARHIHVTRETFVALFGEDAELTKKKDLSQPGQFACAEKITVVGPKGEFAMSILGPYRNADQVEVSLTDARKLGIAVPTRESGDIEGTPGCKLVGPKGELEITKGVIAAQRHVHLTPEDAEAHGVAPGPAAHPEVGPEVEPVHEPDFGPEVGPEVTPPAPVEDAGPAAGAQEAVEEAGEAEEAES